MNSSTARSKALQVRARGLRQATSEGKARSVQAGRGEDTAVGFAEPGGDTPPDGGELVALGALHSGDHPFPLQPAQVRGGLAAGVGEVLQ